MAVCDLTGKGKQHGHNVSFSLRRTKRTFKPNIQKKTLIVDGQKVKNLTKKRSTIKNKPLRVYFLFCFFYNYYGSFFWKSINSFNFILRCSFSI